MPIERSQVNKAPRGQGKVIAVFSYRYDAHLVPGLLANVGPAVQGWVGFDDRPSSGALTDEPARRNALVEAAKADGADWILAVDPDERFEKSFWERIGDMTRLDQAPALWTFQFCEMFTADAWRIDGLWGAKRKMVLFPAAVAKPSPAALHGGWVADTSGMPIRSSQLRLYHLRMATPERRKHRRDTYASADPERQYQAIGYDYLADETGQVLRDIEPDRSFHPPFVEDGGLWAPPQQVLVPGPPDPPATRMRFIDFARRRAGAAGTISLATRLARRRGGAVRAQRPATRVARPAVAKAPDVDFLGLAGQLALEAQKPRTTDRLLSPALDASGNDSSATAFLRLLRAQARFRLTDRKAVAADLALLRRVLPDTPLIERLAKQARSTRRFDGPKAPWRRWAGPGAVMFEGEHVVASAHMAVIVIGFGAPPELRDAVASVLTQDVPTEVVVVNTGGGDVRSHLAPYLDRIRLISCETPLYVGAARNIGIDASRAPVVAFLASDCTARPGWVARRLARHRAGAPAVGNPVMPARPENLISRAVNIAMHHRRHPLVSEDLALRYGVSYARWLFLEFGYFPPGLRVSEDTAFNSLVRSRYVIDWAPDVLTTHRYPTHLRGLLLDQFSRGQRRAALPNFAPGAIKTGTWAQVRAATKERHDAALAAVRHLEPGSSLQGSAVRALLHLTSWADALGTLMTFRRRARADIARQEAISRLSSDPGSAVQQLRAALKLNPQDVDLRLNLATALATSGKPEDLRRARRACLQAADIAPAALGPLNHLCELLIERGQVDQALAEAEAAVARSPSIGPFWAKASTLALRQGDHVRALFYGQGALALAPAVSYAHHRLARVYHLLGLRDRERWRAQWAETLK